MRKENSHAPSEINLERTKLLVNLSYDQIKDTEFFYMEIIHSRCNISKQFSIDKNRRIASTHIHLLYLIYTHRTY